MPTQQMAKLKSKQKYKWQRDVSLDGSTQQGENKKNKTKQLVLGLIRKPEKPQVRQPGLLDLENWLQVSNRTLFSQ